MDPEEASRLFQQAENGKAHRNPMIPPAVDLRFPKGELLPLPQDSHAVLSLLYGYSQRAKSLRDRRDSIGFLLSEISRILYERSPLRGGCGSGNHRKLIDQAGDESAGDRRPVQLRMPDPRRPLLPR